MRIMQRSTMPDIRLLPELSVLLGVTIDALFAMTDESCMTRIENRLKDVRFLLRQEFEATEQYLREQREEPQHKARGLFCWPGSTTSGRRNITIWQSLCPGGPVAGSGEG